MKTKTIGLILALCFFGAALCFAEDPFIGTWKMNEAKSKIPAGTAKINVVIKKAVGDNMKVSMDWTNDRGGKSGHNEWTGKFDGKDYPVTGDQDYPVTGDPMSDMRSYKKVDDRTLEVTMKKDGKLTDSGRWVLTADGKSCFVTMNGIPGVRTVYDKQ
jgi:hypothetical protein